MNREEVIKLIGESNWPSFTMWMYGQTIGLNDDGSADYYEYDVLRYKLIIDFMSG
jgi:hypothetical protein